MHRTLLGKLVHFRRGRGTEDFSSSLGFLKTVLWQCDLFSMGESVTAESTMIMTDTALQAARIPVLEIRRRSVATIWR